jgi:hypothetical protein
MKKTNLMQVTVAANAIKVIVFLVIDEESKFYATAT